MITAPNLEGFRPALEIRKGPIGSECESLCGGERARERRILDYDPLKHPLFSLPVTWLLPKPVRKTQVPSPCLS